MKLIPKIKIQHKLLICITFLIFLFAGCKEEKQEQVIEPPIVINTGSADFTSFVVIGNSVTAGFQSNSLYQSGQEYSFGKLIADQVHVNFEQPLISDPGTGNRIELESSFPLKFRINTGAGAEVNHSFPHSFNNLGVPGAYTYDIVNAYSKQTSYSAIGGGSGNDFINYVLRGRGTQFQECKSLNPTFVILWIGNNDILGHAISGGIFPATSLLSFESFYRQMADSIASLNTEVMVGNIFDVSAIPYFTTIGLLQFQVNGIDSVWGIAGTGDTLLLDLNKNFVTLRAAAEEIYDAEGNKTARGLSRSLPIRSQYILDEDEVRNAVEIVDGYNEIIATVAAEKGFTLIDFNSFLKTIKAAEISGGYVADGQKFTTLFLGNLFSLDGIHPSNQGQAILANEIIRIINQKYGAEIPEIKISAIKNNYISEEIEKLGKRIPLFPPDAFKYFPF